MNRVKVAARAGADDGSLRRSLRHIWSDHLREQDGDHVHANPACTGSEDSLPRHGATVPPDNLLHLPGRRNDYNAKPVRRDRPAGPRGVDGLQALQAGAVRPPEGKPAASEGPDGEVRRSRSSLVRMRDMDPPEVPLCQAPYNTPQDVASNPRILVQVAEQVHPLVQRRPSANQMREHRNNRAHEEVIVGGGATPHG